jgi:sugar phosphate isomerase/epimerase
VKLKAISQAGFYAIELSMPDLLPFANEKPKRSAPKTTMICVKLDPRSRKLCQELGLKILILQLFATFEGWKGSVEVKDAIERAKEWVRIMGKRRLARLGSGPALATLNCRLDHLTRQVYRPRLMSPQMISGIWPI